MTQLNATFFRRLDSARDVQAAPGSHRKSHGGRRALIQSVLVLGTARSWRGACLSKRSVPAIHITDSI